MSNRKKKLIFIVEDEFFLAESIQQRLENMGFTAIIAENGQEAMDLLQSSPCDLIIMDLMMPVMDGWEATQKVKGDDRLKKIPVIVLSARGTEEDKKKAKQLGADEYLIKPFSWDDLISLIEKWTKQ